MKLEEAIDVYNSSNRILDQRFMPNPNNSYSHENFHFLGLGGNQSADVQTNVPFQSRFAIVLEARKEKKEKLRKRQSAILGFEEDDERLDIVNIQRVEKRYMENLGVSFNTALFEELVHIAKLSSKREIFLNPNKIQGTSIEDQSQLQGLDIRARSEIITKIYWSIIKIYGFRESKETSGYVYVV